MTHLEFRFRFMNGSEESTELKGAESESGEEESRPVRDEVESLVIVRVGSLSGIGEIFGETVHCRERKRGLEMDLENADHFRERQNGGFAERNWGSFSVKRIQGGKKKKKCIYKL